MVVRNKKIALLVESSNAYARGLIRGAFSFAHRQANWSVFFSEQERGAIPPEWMSNWKGDGVLARIESPGIAQVIEKLNLPVVDLSAARLIANIPWVETDDKSIASLAAEHLLSRGFTELGFCGDEYFNWSNWRLEEFRKAVGAAGANLHTYNSTSTFHKNFDSNRERSRLAGWVKSLPKPIGIMACYDNLARQLLDVCHETDIGVPEKVAVIGVDNDPMICELSDPPLTSVETDPIRAGYLAADLLDQLINGKEVSSDGLLVKPLGIEERLSTDTVAVDDPDVAKALRYIRERATENIRVNDVVTHVDISRRKLETRFQRLLGRTPHQEIQRRRIDKVKQLLSHTDLPLAEIAGLTGFEHSEYLSVAFQRETGQKTTAFRTANKKMAVVDF